MRQQAVKGFCAGLHVGYPFAICGLVIIKTITINLRAVQILLGHEKIDSTVKYLGVEVEDALTLSESIEL